LKKRKVHYLHEKKKEYEGVAFRFEKKWRIFNGRRGYSLCRMPRKNSQERGKTPGNPALEGEA